MIAVCPVASCARAFNSVCALMRHTEDIHGKSAVYQGAQAWEEMRDQEGLLTTENQPPSDEDMEIHIDGDAYKCETDTWDCGICDREFNAHIDLSRHANSGVHDDNSYHCDDCGREFKMLNSLYSHVNATNCKYVRHVTNTLCIEYQQGNSFLRIADGSAHEAVLYFDGAARPNPGDGGTGFVLLDAYGNVLEEQSCEIIADRCTSNQAEYCALIQGFQSATNFHIRTLLVKGDSKLIINQMLGHWDIKSETMRQLNEVASKWEETFERVQYEWIRREQNGEADALAKQGARYDGFYAEELDYLLRSI